MICRAGDASRRVEDRILSAAAAQSLFGDTQASGEVGSAYRPLHSDVERGAGSDAVLRSRLAENIRDLIASADAEDQAARDAIGRAVVQALTEIDDIANAMSAGTVDQCSVTLAGLSANVAAASVRTFGPTRVAASAAARRSASGNAQ